MVKPNYHSPLAYSVQPLASDRLLTKSAPFSVFPQSFVITYNYNYDNEMKDLGYTANPNTLTLTLTFQSFFND